MFKETSHEMFPCRVEDLWTAGYINRFRILLQDEWNEWGPGWTDVYYGTMETVTVRADNGRMILESDLIGRIVITPMDDSIRKFFLDNDGSYEAVNQMVYTTNRRHVKEVFIVERSP